MLDELTATDVMTRDVVTVSETTNLHDVAKLMGARDLTALPVTNEEGQCVGFLTKTDVIEGVHNYSDTDLTVGTTLSSIYYSLGVTAASNQEASEVMATRPLYVKADSPLTYVIDKMLLHKVHHVPVCDESKRLLGIVSTMDILHAIRHNDVTRSSASCDARSG
jgi:CBS domain-containing membrane protein